MTNPNTLSDNEQEHVLSPTTADELKDILRGGHVPVDEWNPEAGTKTAEQLMKEISKGDTVLISVPVEDGETSGERKLLRKTSVVWVDVYATDADDKRWHLKEAGRTFKPDENGKVRPPDARPHLLASLAEKGQPHETIDEVAARALEEELKIEDQLPIRFVRSDRLPDQESRSYPGLQTRAEAHFFTAELPLSQYKPEGYSIEEDDKWTQFIWEPAPDEQVA